MNVTSIAAAISVLTLMGCAITEDGRSRAPLTDGGSGAGGTTGSSSSGGAGANPMGGNAGIKDGAVAERDATAVCPQSIDDYCKTEPCQRTRPSEPRLLCDPGSSDLFIYGCGGRYDVYSAVLADGGTAYTYDAQSNELLLVEIFGGHELICVAGPPNGLPDRTGLDKICSHLGCKSDAALPP